MIFVISLLFSVLTCCLSATMRLRNGDIVEIQTINTGNGMSRFELDTLNGGFQRILANLGSEQPVSIEIVEDKVPSTGQTHYYNNRYGMRPMQVRPGPPPDGYAHGQSNFPNWNPPPPHPAHQEPPPYNPHNPRPIQHHHQMQHQYGQTYGQRPYNNDQFIITKQPDNPNYPEFEIYTVDVTDPGKNQYPNHNNNRYPNHNNNQYPNHNNNQYPNHNNNQYPNPNQNQYPNFEQNNSDQSENYSSEENDSKDQIKDKVDGYLDKFPVILLKENEIRRR